MLKEMRYFCEVVQQQSLAAAARSLKVSTPMMTRHVQHLEEELGAVLLNRTTRGMSLTEAGDIFYQQAKHIISTYEAGKRAIKGSVTGEHGAIKIGLPASIANLCVVPKLHEFNIKHPHLSIEIMQGNHLLDMIHKGFDCVVFCGDLPDSSYYYKKIGSWRKHTCVSPIYYKTCAKITKPQQLQQYHCLLHMYNKNQIWQFIDKNNQNIKNKVVNLYINSSYKSDSSLLLAKMAIQGLGFSYLPDFTISPYLKSGQLISILDSWMPDPLGIYVVYPHKKYINARLCIIIDFIQSCLNDDML